MPIKGQVSVKPDQKLARLLEHGIKRRCSTLRIPVEQLPTEAGLARDSGTLYSWMKGRSRIPFQDMVAIDRFFSQRGMPGLIEECQQMAVPAQWRYRDMTLEALSAEKKDLLEAAIGLKKRLPMSTGEIADCLGEHYDKVIMLSYPDACFRPFHFGRALPVDVGVHVMSRDIRTIVDKDYGDLLHRSLKEVMMRGPLFHRIESHQLTYDRLAVPITENIVLTSSFNWNFAPDRSPKYQLV